MNTTQPQPCECVDRGPGLAGASHLGEDATGGRFADVMSIVCARCGRLWLTYRFEIEAFSRSDRWYAGVVVPDDLIGLLPEDVPALLARLDWHLRGGSYFGGKVMRASGEMIGL